MDLTVVSENSDTDNIVTEMKDTYKKNEQMLTDLQAQCKPGDRVRLVFKTPTKVWVTRRKSEVVDSLVVRGFFTSATDNFCYYLRNMKRCGLWMTFDMMMNLKSAEIVSGNDEFASLEEFKMKFDTRFVTDECIHDLYKAGNTSCGRPWRKSDFRRIPAKGRRVMNEFLGKFSDIRVKTKHYTSTLICPKSYVEVDRPVSGKNGRDIKIYHVFGTDAVYYNSEYPHCANGDYYMVASRGTVLYLERD